MLTKKTSLICYPWLYCHTDITRRKQWQAKIVIKNLTFHWLEIQCTSTVRKHRSAFSQTNISLSYSSILQRLRKEWILSILNSKKKVKNICREWRKKWMNLFKMQKENSIKNLSILMKNKYLCMKEIKESIINVVLLEW